MFVDRTLRVQRIVLTVTLAGAALAFWRESYDVFNTLKATLVVLGAIAVIAVAGVRLSRTRELVVPVTRAWWIVGVFVAGLLVGTLAASNTLRAVVGEPGRHTGLAMYIVYAGLFAVALRLHRDRLPTTLTKGLVVAAIPVAGYGLLQAAGVQVFDWVTFEGGPQVVSSFGNANFLAAWLGIVVPLFIWLALSALRSIVWRMAAGVVAAVSLIVASATGSLQGIAAAVPGAGLVLAVWLWTEAPPVLRRRRTAILGAGGAAVAGAVLLTAAGIGPFASVRRSAVASYESRAGKWDAAWRMFTDNPLTGVGIGGDFGDRFFSYRTVQVATESGLRRSVDDPHNVVLAMFANGGLLLGLAYLALIGFTGWALARGLRRLDGQERLALAGIGGGWLAYQVQSLVSIDVPPLAVLHWVLAGIIVALGTEPTFRIITLPGAAAPVAAKGRRETRPRLRPLTPGVVVGVGVFSLGAAALAVTPLRADLAAADGRSLAARGQQEAAIDAYEKAVAVGKWEALYPALEAKYLTDLGMVEDARERHMEAAAREPHDLVHAINIARTSKALDDYETARRAYDRAYEIDPKTPEVLAEIGEFELEHGDPHRAAELLGTAVDRRDGNAKWWLHLGQARAEMGDEDAARQAFERALDIEPGLEAAEEGLATLS